MSAEAPDGLRIDDLARRAGLTVDTIRYYQREGLLPAAVRVGRTKVYGPEHLARLGQIRELQARRFSLAAIKSLLESDRSDLVDGIFSSEEGSLALTLDELVERSGGSAELVEQLQRAGLLRDPSEFGRDAYDATDLDVMCAAASLERLALPADVLGELSGIYVQGVEAMQQEVLALFSGERGKSWSPEELHAFQEHAAAAAGELLPLVTRIVDYVHRRTLQRLTLGAIERSQQQG
jgi:DNA-binding transcriptional MerR regulator